MRQKAAAPLSDARIATEVSILMMPNVKERLSG